MQPDPGKNYQTLEGVTLNQNTLKALVKIEKREYGDGVRYVFVLRRGNSRPLDTEVNYFVNVVRELGALVFIEVMGVEVTLEQFEYSGVWSVKKPQTVMLPQGRYNSSSRLSQLRAELQTMDPNDPTYPQRLQAVAHLERMLETAQPKLDAATVESAKALTNISEMIAREAFDKTLALTDEELAGFGLDQLEALGVPKMTKQWEILLTRWANARKALHNQKEMDNDNSQVGG